MSVPTSTLTPLAKTKKRNHKIAQIITRDLVQIFPNNGLTFLSKIVIDHGQQWNWGINSIITKFHEHHSCDGTIRWQSTSMGTHFWILFVRHIAHHGVLCRYDHFVCILATERVTKYYEQFALQHGRSGFVIRPSNSFWRNLHFKRWVGIGWWPLQAAPLSVAYILQCCHPKSDNRQCGKIFCNMSTHAFQETRSYFQVWKANRSCLGSLVHFVCTSVVS